MPTGVVLLFILAALVGIPWAFNAWYDRREDEVDDFYERDFRDPPAIGHPGIGGGQI